jgi:ADP-ribose pyrophosphatase YjhB (NUDIX family)
MYAKWRSILLERTYFMNKPEEKTLLEAVDCFLINSKGEVWLATKAFKIGAGCLNGYGGGIEKGETPEICALREIPEECAIKVTLEQLHKVAVMDFHNNKTDGSMFICRVHMFLVYTNEIPQESAEMLAPRLFDPKNLPLTRLMPADPYWLPHLFQGKKFIGKAEYSPYQKELIGYVTITYVDKLPER